MAKEQKLAWIDALRGIAILMVIAVHTSHGLKGHESFLTEIFSFGGLGVQLFFIASAITLCMSLDRNLGKDNWFWSYSVRRYFRIAPMYYIGIVIYFFWSFAKNYVEHGLMAPLPQYTPLNIFANVFFIHGYVPGAYNDIVPGGWSIAVETSFYLVFPLLFLAYRRYAQYQVIQTALLLLVCYVIAALPQVYSGTNTVDNPFLYFNISNQLQVFIIGIIGYYRLESLRNTHTFALLGLLLLFGFAGYEFWNAPVFNARFIALASYASMFVILAALASKYEWDINLLSEIGKRSFSMYVLHFMIMNIIDYLLNVRFQFLVDHELIKAVAHYAIAVTIVFIAAGFTKKYIEDRFIRYGARIASSR